MELHMPERKTIERARRDKREGKAPTTQAIAIGLSKARRAGVKLPPPEKGEASEETRRSAQRALEAGEKPSAKVSPERSRAITTALKREGDAAASPTALSRQAKAAARERTAAERSDAAKKAARTKGPAERSEAARKAAHTRAEHKASH
jgi:hypothetical protein